MLMKMTKANRFEIHSEISRMSHCTAGCLLVWISTCIAPQWLVAQVPAQFASQAQLASQLQRTETTGDKLQEQHGGSRRQVGSLFVESVVEDSGIKIYMSDSGSQPVVASAVRGVAMLRIEGEAKTYRYDLLPTEKNQLSAAANLSRFSGRQIILDVMLTDLPTGKASDRRARQPTKFRDVFTLSPTEQQLAAQAIAIQKVCPVTGRRLGSMGEPLPVAAGNKTVFVCCSSCVEVVHKEPAKYASGKPAIAISTATAADNELIAKQKICPVMDEPLGGMGQPIKVMIGETPIFLCCKGCIKKIQAEPAKYLAMVYGDTGVPTDAKRMR